MPVVLPEAQGGEMRDVTVVRKDSGARRGWVQSLELGRRIEVCVPHPKGELRSYRLAWVMGLLTLLLKGRVALLGALTREPPGLPVSNGKAPAPREG